MRASRIRVLEVQADDPWGGAAAHVVSLVGSLPKDVNAKVVSPRGGHMDRSDVPLIPWESGQSLRDILTAHPADLIHLHGVRAGKEGWLALRGTSQPVIYTEHLWTKAYHLANPVREWVQVLGLRLIAARASAVIAPSEAVASFLVGRGIVSAEKLYRIPHGIAERPACTQPAELVVGMVGSLNRTKRYDLALDALVRIGDAFSWRLVVFGTGEERPALERRAKELHLDDRIEWRANAREVQFCDFSVLLHTSSSESFGLSVAEAMAAGVPVVVTKVGALPELVGEAGIVVENDSRAIASTLTKLFNDRKARQSLGAKGQSRVRSLFSVAGMAEATASVYRTVYETHAH